MATIIVEDGTGKTDSNSYASAADLATYAADRGVTITGTDTELLIQAMDYIELQPFKGDKAAKLQALQWPRLNVWIDGFFVDFDEIPLRLVEAQLEAALATDAGNNPLASVGREVKRQKLEGLEQEFMDGARATTYNKALESKLRKLLKHGAGSINAVAVRA